MTYKPIVKQGTMVAYIVMSLMFLSMVGVIQITLRTPVDTPLKRFLTSSMFLQAESPSSLDVQVVYDEESDALLHYGGWIPEYVSDGYSSVQDYSNATWVYNFTTDSWSNVQPIVNPGPRFSYAAAYDSEYDHIIIYGGATSEDNYNGDTWMYEINTNTWANMSPLSSPGLRFGASLVYDSESDIMVLFGGLDFPALFGHHIQQTWVYDFDTNNWTNMEPDVQPIGRHHTSMVYDSESDRVILFGGYVSSAPDEASSETWSYDYNTNSWNEMDSDSNIEARFYGAMAYDASSDRSILYGGAWDYSNNAGLGDTWAYDYNADSWEKMVPNPHPPERWRHSSAFRSETNEIILVSGSFGDIEGGEKKADSMWTYDYENDRWSNLDGNFVPALPGAPENPIIMIYDGVVYLTWEPPSNETGQAITGYNIYRGTESADLELFSSLGSVLFFQDISMTPGTTYYYQITAVTPAGEGIPSVTFSAGLPASVPILEISIGVGVILLVSICFFYRRKKQT